MFFGKKSKLIGTDVVKAYIEILRQSGCMNFLEKIVEDDTSEFLRLPILSKEAAESIKKLLRVRLENIYRQPLMRELRFAVEEFDVTEYMYPAGKSREALDKAAKKVLNGFIQENAKNLKKKYFLLNGYEENVRKNFRDFIREFLESFSLRQNEISAQILDGKKITKILSLGSDGSDTHRHGRTVIRVTTDAGIFYYKPHDCLVDVLYEKIVAKYFSDCTVAAKIISGEGYGFVKEFLAADVEKIEDVAKYFYNFGILTAMFHSLGSVDMHNENIMSCGVYPCAVDLETLFTVEKESVYKFESISDATKDFNFSVLRTAVLPNRVHLMGVVSPLYPFGAKTGSLPHFQGNAYSVEGYEEKFLQGFNDGYERILTHIEEIVSLIRDYEDATIRIIIRNTVYYSHIQAILFREENLSSEKNRQGILDKLTTHYEKNNGKIVPSIIKHETNALLEGEIPYFCVQLDGYALCGNCIDEVLQEDYLAKSAKKVAESRLRSLSVAEKIFELEYIRSHFKHALLDEKVSYKKFAYAEKSLDIADAENLAGEIFEDLLGDVIHTTNGTPAWCSPVLNGRQKPSIGILTPQINAAQYCGKILKRDSLAKFHEQAGELKIKCIEAVNAQIKLWRKTDTADLFDYISTGIYDGLGGIISACVELDEEKLLQNTLKLIEEKKIYNRKNTDLADGTSGLIWVMSKIKTPEKFQLENLIRNCAENILEKGFDKEVDAPHGKAGLGTALAIAYKFTGDEKFLKVAKDAFEEVRAAYMDHINGWSDEDSIAWLATREPKSAGIGLCAMYAAEFADEKIFDEVLNLALHSVETEDALFWNDSLDNGNALYVKFLTKAAKKFNRKDYLERAGKILAAMVERSKTAGHFRLTDKGVKTSFEAVMFTGSLGIGCAALEFSEAFR